MVSGGALWVPPARSEAEPQPKSNLVHFSFKRWYLLATILIIFSKINWPNWQIACTLNVYLCFTYIYVLCAMILSETLALYKSFTYLLTYLRGGLWEGRAPCPPFLSTLLVRYSTDLGGLATLWAMVHEVSRLLGHRRGTACRRGSRTRHWQLGSSHIGRALYPITFSGEKLISYRKLPVVVSTS